MTYNLDMTELATKITPTVFCYRLIGFSLNVLYDSKNRSLILADKETGASIKIVEADEYLDFESFILVSRNIFMDLVDSSN